MLFLWKRRRSFQSVLDSFRILKDVYCPWDVINQCDKLRTAADAKIEPHWENSSSNAIIHDLIEDAAEATKAEIEALISGETVEKLLIPELTYTDLNSQDAEIRQAYLWSVLFASGHLNDLGEMGAGLHRLVIPNKEVLGIYEKKINSWFKIINKASVDTVYSLAKVFGCTMEDLI